MHSQEHMLVRLGIFRFHIALCHSTSQSWTPRGWSYDTHRLAVRVREQAASGMPGTIQQKSHPAKCRSLGQLEKELLPAKHQMTTLGPSWEILLVRNTRFFANWNLKKMKLRSKVQNTKTNFLAKKKQSFGVFWIFELASASGELKKGINLDVTAQVSTDKKP